MSDDRQQSYLNTFRKSIRGEAITFEEFLDHFGSQNANPKAGIELGARVGAFSLVDQQGNPRSLADLTGPKGLLVVFVRSANWCGYCRNQLAELNLARDLVEKEGFQIAAISSDLPEITRSFARANRLQYPLLADPDGEAIDIFAIGNDNVPPEAVKRLGLNKEGISGRIPFPAHFLLDPEGTVLAKSVCDDLRHRPSGTTLLFKHLGPDNEANNVTISTDHLAARVSVAARSVHAGQELAVSVSLIPAEGVHIYAPAVAGGYSGLEILFEDELIAAQEFDFPAAKNQRFDTIGEDLPAYDTEFTVAGMLRLKWSPPIHGSRQLRGLEDRLASIATEPGSHELRGRLSYQACTSEICYPPVAVPFSLSLEILPDVDKIAPVFDRERD